MRKAITVLRKSIKNTYKTKDNTSMYAAKMLEMPNDVVEKKCNTQMEKRNLQ
jgi:hypothetical protein